MPDGNIIVSYAFMDLIEIVDKATGDIKWRWGGAGKLGFQHNPTLLANGNILLFDNGRHRPLAPDYTRVIEINPTTNEIEWEYKADPPTDFYASFIGGCQRLPNGNTLICEGPKGRFFEVRPAGEIVWEYINPFYYQYSRFGLTNMTFRAYRYGPDYPGLKGTGLDDMNLVYGPGTFTPEDLPSRGGMETEPLTERREPLEKKKRETTEELPPTVAKLVGEMPSAAKGKKKLRSRLRKLGY